jgi:hypothetical protein
MKKIALLLVVSSVQSIQAGVGVPVTRSELVPDEKTAITIAKAVLIPIFGEDFNQYRARKSLANPHAFYASSYKQRWIVEDAPPARLQ